MKLTAHTLIEGKIVEAGTEIKILDKMSEAFRAGSHQRIMKIIDSYLNKYVKIDFDYEIPEGYKNSLGSFIGYTGWTDNGVVRINFQLGGSEKLYSVDMLDEMTWTPITTIVLEPDNNSVQNVQAIKDLLMGTLEESVGGASTRLFERKPMAYENVRDWIEDQGEFRDREDDIVNKRLSDVYTDYVRSQDRDKKVVSQSSFTNAVKMYLDNQGLSNKYSRGTYKVVKVSKSEEDITLPDEVEYQSAFLEVNDELASWEEAFDAMEFYFEELMDDQVNPPYGMVVYGNGGTGKAQPLYSRVLTPSGWTTMGEIEVGDFVSTPDGGEAKVLKTFPQGENRSVYELEFSNGVTVRCDEDHLWKVWYQGNTNKTSVKTLKEIMDVGLKDSQGRWQWSIPIMSKPYEFEAPETPPIDSYTMGVLLGDGCFRGNMITFTSDDDEIIDALTEKAKLYDSRVNSYGGVTYGIANIKAGDRSHPNRLKEIIKDLGLYSLKSEHKFIPEVYKNSSVEDRLSLIQGIMDADGYAEKNGHSVLSLSSERLIDDVAELVRSLGGWASKNEKIVKYDYQDGRKESVAYNLSVALPEGMPLFKLKRKSDRYSEKKLFKKGLTIRDIKYIGKEETKCILIDSPEHLYVTDNYIVTHNSFMIESQRDNYDNFLYKGAPNTKELVQILYENRDKELIIFDDADSVITNKNSANILKSALTDTGERNVYLPSKTGFFKNPERLPDVVIESGSAYFNFNASIVVITNLEKGIPDKALESRVYKAPIFMDKFDIIDKIKKTVDPTELGATPAQADAVASFLVELVDSGNFDIKNEDLSYRFFKRGLKCIKGRPTKWKKLVMFQLGLGIKTSIKKKR